MENNTKSLANPNSRQKFFRFLACIITLIAIIVLIGLTEYLFRMQGHKPYVRTLPQDVVELPNPASWVKFDQNLGWVSAPKPGVNAQGFRDAKDFGDHTTNLNRIKVMMLGDSFVWGAGVQDNETIPFFLKQSLGKEYQIYSLGVPGWGVDQMWLAYLEYRDWIHPDIVVLVFIDDDIKRMLESHRRAEKLLKPVLWMKNNRPERKTNHHWIDDLLNKITGHSAILGYLRRRWLIHFEAKPLMHGIVKSLVSETELRDESLYIVRIPTPPGLPWYFNFDSNPVSEVSNSFDLTILDTSHLMINTNKSPQVYYQQNGHLSAKGNQVVSDAISDLINSEYSLKKRSSL